MSEVRRRSTFRTHLILTSVASTGVYAGLIAASLFVPLVAQLDRPGLDTQAAGGIAEQILFLHRNFWPVVLGSLIASIGSALLLYQRMTGPLVRFLHAFRQIARGEVPKPLTLRRIDYLTDEAAVLNEMVEALRVRDGERRAALARCAELLDDLSATSSQAEREPIVEALRDALKGVA